jgi:plasmid segregation protein ParM
MEDVVRSIDLGYGFTKYVREVRAGQPEFASFPSMAPLAHDGDLGEALGLRRDTAVIDIDRVRYEVGPDVGFIQRAFTVRNMDDDYVTTPAYLALLRGALSFMKRDQIEVLVVGLPVSMVKSRRSHLERLVACEHAVGRERVVKVRSARVLAQPHGALLDCAARAKDGRQVLKQTNLVIDCGFRTVDWLLTQGLKPVEARSGSVPRGMYDVVRDISDRISVLTGSPFYAYSRLDHALRTGRAPLVDGREMNIEAAVVAARQIVEEAVTEMKRSLQCTRDIDNILLVGGAAFFFRAAIESMLGDHEILLVRDAYYSNVRGLQLAGIAWASQRARERAAEA